MHVPVMPFAVPPTIIACLACGWVHGPPWRCPESARKIIRVFRVGKANTLLMTPNDWSTLSNGTVDGVPTGLHRYAGENRFVFVLLNVTDGHGNLVSYDLESKDWNGAYTDLSGTGLTGYHAGDTPEPGRFGLAAKMNGTSSYVSNDNTAKLNDINDALTVAFWIRPDEDYVGGTPGQWRWSTGREGLWRLGYYNDAAGTFHGLRFEVKDSAGNVRAVQTAYSLYAGRWVHLAATLTRRENVGGSTWSDLDLYADGEKVAPPQSIYPAFSAMDGATSLRIGHDLPGGGRFKGLVDEFRLYKTSLAADGVRGLPWFLHGSNNVIVPRGVFFDSKLYASLNASSYDSTSPLAGANVHGNDNKGTAHLNARVIQMVITRNATLAQASQILTLARTNTTNVVTAFPLLVASEYYTLGLAKEVRDLAANVVVENSGNFSAPPPSPTLWQLFWNTLAGIAGAVWNAVVAVGQFFYNVGKWLVDAAIGILYGLLTNNWTYFQQNVLEPLRKALEALVKFVLDIVRAVVDLIFKPIWDAFSQWKAQLDSIFARIMLQGDTDGADVTMLSEVLLGNFFSILKLFVLAFFGLQIVLLVFSALFPGALGIATLIKELIVQGLAQAKDSLVSHWKGLAISAILGFIVGSLLNANDPFFATLTATGTTILSFLALFVQVVSIRLTVDPAAKIGGGDFIAMAINLAGLFISIGFASGPHARFATILGAALSGVGLLIALGAPDLLPGVIGFLDELVEMGVLAFDLAQARQAFG